MKRSIEPIGPSPRTGFHRWARALPLLFVFFSLLALLVVPLAVTRRIGEVCAEISGRVEPARAALIDVDLALTREVAAVRGYLLTGDERLHAAYRSARAAERVRQGELEEAARALSPALERRALRLRLLSDRWNAVNIDLPAGAGPEERARWLLGRQAMYEAVLDEAVTLGTALSAEAEARRDRIRSLERLSLLLTAILTGLALASTAFLLLTGLRLAGEADRLERRVQARTAELSEANEELQSFAHTVSHDLRAPVRAVSGFAQALEEDAGPRLTPEERDFLDRIQRAARRMNFLIDDLLAYSRLARVRIELDPVSLGPLAEEAVAAAREGFPDGAGEVIIVGPLPRVSAHRATLAQAVQNLVANALKFVPPGRAPRVVVRAETRAETARLWVEDNGIGIAAEHRERIFRVFERLHGVESYPGTGIGLAIVRRSAERMGGRAGVESTPGEGSRFWIELPLAKPDEK